MSTNITDKDGNLTKSGKKWLAIQGIRVNANEGIICQRCECPDLKVYKTIRVSGYILRYRACRNCGWHTRTKEYIG